MKNRNKFLFFILGIAIFAGILCSGIILAAGIQKGADAPAPRREKYPDPHVLEKTELDEFSEISIGLSYANVSILPSDGFYLEYRLDGKCSKPDYGVSNGKFHFQEGPMQTRYHISLNLFGTPANREPFYLNLYVPEKQYIELLHMSVESGDMEIEQLNAKKADLSLDYGDLNLETFTGDSLEIASESGNINTDHVDCGRLTLTASYGNYTGNTLSVSEEGTFSLESGDLEIASLTAGSCSVNSDYGDCVIDSFQAEDGTFSLESGNLKISSLTADTCSVNADYGDCVIDNFQGKNSTFSLESGSLNLGQASLEQLKADLAYGDAALELADKIDDFNYDLKAEYGSVKVDGKNIEASEEDGTVRYQKQNSGKTHSISVQCESGHITVQ